MRVLITGSGVHCGQFVDGLMFCKEYELTVYTQQSTPIIEQIKNYGIKVAHDGLPSLATQADIIVLADLPEERLSVIRQLEKAEIKASVLVDKPSTLSASKEKELQSFLKDKPHLFAYSRFFEMDKIVNELGDVADAKELNITWPNFYELGIQLIRDTLPHALEMLFLLNPQLQKICHSFDYTENQLKLHFDDGERVYNFKIFNTADKSQKVTVNGKSLEWLNYFIYIPSMLKSLIKQDDGFFKANHLFNDNINHIFFEINERKN